MYILRSTSWARQLLESRVVAQTISRDITTIAIILQCYQSSPFAIMIGRYMDPRSWTRIMVWGLIIWTICNSLRSLSNILFGHFFSWNAKNPASRAVFVYSSNLHVVLLALLGEKRTRDSWPSKQKRARDSWQLIQSVQSTKQEQSMLSIQDRTTKCFSYFLYRKWMCSDSPYSLQE
jgi:hypothetical protein